MDKQNKNKDYISSISRASKILDAVFESEAPVGVSPLSKAVGLPKVTTFRILSTLVDCGLLIKDDNELYSLSPRFIIYGDKVKSSLSLKNIAEPVINSLASQVEESANVGVAYRGYVLTIAHVSIGAYLLVTSLSPLSDLHCSSMGKIILAHKDEPSLREYFNRPLKKYTSNTIIDYDSFKKSIDFFAETSVMCDDEEFEYGLYCFSAPIYDANHRLIAAISVSGPKTRMLSKSEEIKKHLLCSAKKITSLLEESRYTVEDLQKNLV